MKARNLARHALLLTAALALTGVGGAALADTTAVTITLDKALFSTRDLEGKTAPASDRRNLHLDSTVQEGAWGTVIGMAPNFNRGHHRGRVLDARHSGKTLKLTIEMSITGDPWIPGGRAVYDVTLEPAKGGEYTHEGSYTGVWNGYDVSGKARASFMDPPAAEKGFRPFKPGEHPRMLFRKSDIERLLKRRSHPVVAKAYERIEATARANKVGGDRGEGDGVVANGVMYQLTGEEKYARAARQGVVKMMADHTGGSFNLGHAWGPRVAHVSMAYDLCVEAEAWDEEFTEKVRGYIAWVAQRLIYNPRSVSRKVNWSPNSNYHNFLRGGAAIGTLALAGDKSDKPQPPRNPGLEPGTLAATQVKGSAPRAKMQDGTTSPTWLWVGPFKDEADAGDDHLADAGGADALRPSEGTQVKVAGKTCTFQAVAEKHWWGSGHWTDGKKSIDMTSVTGRAYNEASYYYTVFHNDQAGRLVQYRTGQSGSCNVMTWINGQRVYDKDYLVLDKGDYAVMVRAHIYTCEPWGKIWIRPHFADADRADAQADLKARQIPYKLRVAEYEEDLAAWKASGGGNPLFIYLAELGEYHMSKNYRYLMGDGGYQVEGEGYTLYSIDMPLAYGTIYRNMFGRNVNPNPDLSHFAPRYVATGVYGDKEIHSQSFSLNNGTMKHGHYARTFPVVHEPYKPAVLWAWNQTMGLTGEGKGTPNPGGGMEAVWTFLNYPVDMQARNPQQVMPLTWEAPTKGMYSFRNGWKGPDKDIVAQAFAKAEGPNAWSHPDGGSIRIWGLGRAWGVQGQGNPKAGDRWFENVVILPDDDTNTGSLGQVTHREFHDDGSGSVRMNLDWIYAGRKTFTDAKGTERGMPLVDNSFQFHPENLKDLGIRGWRAFGVDYSRASGAEGLFVLADKIDGGGRKIWQWQIPAKVKVEVTEDGFVFTDGKVTFRATVVAPAKCKVALAETQLKNISSGNDSGKKVSPKVSAVQVIGENPKDGEFLVVFTLSKGNAPKVQGKGSGVDQQVQVGGQSVRFDGKRFLFGRR